MLFYSALNCDTDTLALRTLEHFCFISYLTFGPGICPGDATRLLPSSVASVLEILPVNPAISRCCCSCGSCGGSCGGSG